MSKLSTLLACVLSGILFVPICVEMISFSMGLFVSQPLFILLLLVLVATGSFVCGVAFKVVKDE